MNKEFTKEDAQAENIWSALYESRNHPGVSLQNIAEICGKVFDKEEMYAFVNRLEEIIENMPACEKCGEKTSVKLIGDESYDSCSNCGWITY